MAYMSSLNLSRNAISGFLPPQWASMSSLRYLYLSTNALTGSIPASWGQTWTFLFTAAFEGNKLCGCLPSQWENNNIFVTITVDPAVRAAECAVKNACDALP